MKTYIFNTFGTKHLNDVKPGWQQNLADGICTILLCLCYNLTKSKNICYQQIGLKRFLHEYFDDIYEF